MTTPQDLRLHEEVLLLALKDEEGTTASGTWYQHALAAALVSELLLADSIRVEDGKKGKVQWAADLADADDVLAEALGKIRDSNKPRDLQYWVQKLAGLKDLKHRVAHLLVDRGILKADEDKVLLIFTRRIYPERDPRPEERLVERLRRAIFEDGRELDPRTTVLVALCHSTGILRAVFDKKRLKERKARVEEICKGELVGRAAHQAVQAVEAAVMVAVMTSVIMTSTTHSH